jgi:hypothetical protein
VDTVCKDRPFGLEPGETCFTGVYELAAVAVDSLVPFPWPDHSESRHAMQKPSHDRGGDAVGHELEAGARLSRGTQLTAEPRTSHVGRVMRRQSKKQTPSAGSNNAPQVRVVGDQDEERAELVRSVNARSPVT